MKELEDEGIDHVPRWAPSCPPQAATRPASLSTSPPAPPKPASAPCVCVSQPSEGKDGASQDSKHDGAAAPADSLAELSAATPEGAFRARQQGGQRLSRGCRSFSRASLSRVEERSFCLQINWMQITSSVTSGT